MSKIVSQLVQLGLKLFEILFDFNGHGDILLFIRFFFV